MGSRKVIESYKVDINGLADLLGKLVSSYQALIGSSAQLNGMAASRKSQVKDTLQKAGEIGEMIDEIIKVLEEASNNYLDYCELKSEIIKTTINENYIIAEINEELSFKE
ncbi:hypothetical protein [Clostridium botulinum]|uniref:hypothetical protein n=1 Tax=Clostridium botulinum TaxID=1491 RepID=UPI0004D87C84|nr:hypothetical protein [Clostridium botulinum]KEI03317.1 hypothetical protein Z953_04975 [Clostridium botulinum D str. 16868]